MSTADLISTAAAAASAIAGAFAAVAAFRSASSARDAQRTADEAQRRMALRDLAAVSAEVVGEAKRCQKRAQSAMRSHNDLAIFNNTLGGSRQKLAQDALEAKMARAQEIEADAQLFSGAVNLAEAPPAEVDRVHTRLRAALSEIRGMREDLEREQDSVELRSAEHRDSMARAKYAK